MMQEMLNNLAETSEAGTISTSKAKTFIRALFEDIGINVKQSEIESILSECTNKSGEFGIYEFRQLVLELLPEGKLNLHIIKGNYIIM